MKPLITIFFILLSMLKLFAQTDTLYIKYQDKSSNNSCENIDSNKIVNYPFIPGCSYKYSKVVGEFERSFRFNFYTNTRPEASYQFDYKKIRYSEKSKYPFKDDDWFASTDYYDIIKIFGGPEKIIYLLDERFVKNDSAYLVKVSFHFEAEE